MAKKAAALILAGGLGKRMKSSTPKILQEIGNKKMILHVIDSCLHAKINNITVILGNNKDLIKPYLPKNVSVVIQKKPLGTANAITEAKTKFGKFSGKLIILYADVPFIKSNTIKNLVNSSDKYINLLGFKTENPLGYGRIRLEGNSIKEVIEEKEADLESRKIKLCNSGIFSGKAKEIFNLLSKVRKSSLSQEYLLTDINKIAYKNRRPIRLKMVKEEEVFGVNNNQQLAKAEEIFQKNMRDTLIKKGVKLLAPSTISFSHDTKISNNVKIGANNSFGEGVIIKENVEIGHGCSITNTYIEKESVIGPLCRLRQNTKIGRSAKIGNFVEIKNSTIKDNAKVNHLSYIGDAIVGKNTNIGAGTITCNYDGKNKNKTFIGDRVFIGSNCSLVAPLKIQDNSFVAAGSTITKSLEKGDFAIARSKQVIKRNATRRIMKKRP